MNYDSDGAQVSQTAAEFFLEIMSIRRGKLGGPDARGDKFAKGGSNLAEKVVVTEFRLARVDIPQAEAEVLNLLKVVRDGDLYLEVWVEVILNALCAGDFAPSEVRGRGVGGVAIRGGRGDAKVGGLLLVEDDARGVGLGGEVAVAQALCGDLELDLCGLDGLRDGRVGVGALGVARRLGRRVRAGRVVRRVGGVGRVLHVGVRMGGHGGVGRRRDGRGVLVGRGGQGLLRGVLGDWVVGVVGRQRVGVVARGVGVRGQGGVERRGLGRGRVAGRGAVRVRRVHGLRADRVRRGRLQRRLQRVVVRAGRVRVVRRRARRLLRGHAARGGGGEDGEGRGAWGVQRG